MLTVILSGGNSSRFAADGFVHQKSMLRMPNSQYLLEWQLARLPGDRYLYISRAEYEKSELAMLVRVKNRYPLKSVWIKKKTVGPLDGLWNMRKYLNVAEPLLITYNDELIEQESLIGFVDVCTRQDYPAGLICFDNPDPRFTRVPRTDDYACGCTYFFRSGREFVATMTKIPRGPLNGCPDAVYSYGAWLSFFLGPEEFVELGTALEYKTWMAEQGSPVEDW